MEIKWKRLEDEKELRKKVENLWAKFEAEKIARELDEEKLQAELTTKRGLRNI